MTQLPEETDRNLVFINYRRADVGAIATVVFKHLESCIGENRIFIDRELRRAEDWPTKIMAELDRSAAMVVLIGPNWLTELDKRVKDAENQQLIHTLLDPRAWLIILGTLLANVFLGLGIALSAALSITILLVWLAVAYAVPSPLSRSVRATSRDPVDQVRAEILRAFDKRIRIHPVLVNGATLPLRKQLPADLRALLDYNGMTLHNDQFGAGLDMLCGDLRYTLEHLDSFAPP